MLVNVLANYALIFGRWGFPPMGALGCGIATALGMWTMLVGMVVMMCLDTRYRCYGLFRQWSWPCWRELQPLLALGLPDWHRVVFETAIFATVALLLVGSARWRPPRIRWL
ncbi:MAG: hypothetical protein R3F36_09955 [Candidatus Competibacteraceae bacterium]